MEDVTHGGLRNKELAKASIDQYTQVKQGIISKKMKAGIEREASHINGEHSSLHTARRVVEPMLVFRLPPPKTHS